MIQANGLAQRAKDGGHREEEQRMSRLLRVFALMLAAVALAVLPAVAQAVPHYYKNFPPTAEYPEGVRIPFIAWGKLTLTKEPDLGAVPTCENSAGGYIENPIGGGAGVGQTLRFATWNCNDAECPPGEIEVQGSKYEKEFEISWPPQSFPWPGVLTEPGLGVVKSNSAGVVMEIACVAHKLTRAAAGEGKGPGKEGGENEQFVLPSGGPPTVTCVTDEGHLWQPTYTAGTSASNPSKLVFMGAQSVNLSCAGGAFEAQIKESMKIMGFRGSELINVH